MTDTARPRTALKFLIAGWLVLTAGSALGAWPITGFQIAPRPPVNPGISAEDQREEIETGPNELSGIDAVWDAISGADDERRRQSEGSKPLEGGLEEIATQFSRAGISEPYLMPVVNDNGALKYRVYMYSSFKDLAAYQQWKCGKSEDEISRIEANSKKLAATGSISKPGYFALGHELAHAVQANSLTSNCEKRAFWITEGMANAAGQHVTLQKWPGYFLSLSQTMWPGLRPYDIPLHYATSGLPEKGSFAEALGYQTVSFWRFLVESFGGLKVLAHVMAEPLQKGWSDGQMLDWLDNRLHTEPNIQAGLYLVYPHFVTEFASLGGSRYMEFADSRYTDPKAARVRWTNLAFKGCYQIVLTPDRPVAEIPISVNSVAADCIKVRYEGFGGQGFEHAEVIGDSLSHMDQLHLGWAWIEDKDGLRSCYGEHRSKKTRWPPCILNAYTQTGPAPGKYARTWSNLPIDFGDTTGTPVEKIYVISNVAENPMQTAPIRSQTFKIGLAWATLGDQASEPMPNIPVPRARDASKMSAGRPAKQADFYGLEDAPPLPGPRPVGVGTHRDAPGKASCHALIHTLQYGQTGDVFGQVVQDDSGNPLVNSSLWCDDAAKKQPIGRVLKSDETAFRIAIDAQFCEPPKPPDQTCGTGGCPVAGRCKMEISIPFGWRQFPESAPTDIVTPGVAEYIKTMPDSISEMAGMAFGTLNSGPNTPVSADSGSSSPISADVARQLPDLPTDACTCSCEERAAIERRGEALSAASEQLQGDSMTEFTRYMQCSEQCQAEYLACIFEENEARKSAESAAQERAEAITARSKFESCDCSCPALEAMQERGSYLEEQKNPALLEEQMQILQCFSKCSDEYTSCIMQTIR
jgi:hypothetical protein